MSQKKCPHCGEYVHNNSINCPKCFKEIPRNRSITPEYVIKEDKKERQRKAPAAAVLLALIPPFFGLLGLGIIFMDHKDRKGYWFLLIGLVLFLPLTALFFLMLRSGFISAILLFIVFLVIFLIYVSAAVAAFIETLFGSVFRILRF